MEENWPSEAQQEIEELEMIAGRLEERLRQEFMARFPQAHDDEGDAAERISRWLGSQ